jgi:hypothetical protein
MPVLYCTLAAAESVVIEAIVIDKDWLLFMTYMGSPYQKLSSFAITKVGFTLVVNHPMLGCSRLMVVITFEAVSSEKLVVLLAPKFGVIKSCRSSCKFKASIVLHMGMKACSVLQCNLSLAPRQVATRNRSKFLEAP